MNIKLKGLAHHHPWVRWVEGQIVDDFTNHAGITKLSASIRLCQVFTRAGIPHIYVEGIPDKRHFRVAGKYRMPVTQGLAAPTLQSYHGGRP